MPPATRTSKGFLRALTRSLGALALCLGLFLAPAILLVSPPSASATPQVPEDLELKGESVQQMDRLQAEADRVTTEIDRLDVELERAVESHNEAIVLLDRANRELGQVRRDLESARSTYEYRRDLIGRRVAAAYKAGKTQLLSVLLASDDFGDFLNRLKLVTKITVQDHRVADNLKESARATAALEAQMRDQKGTVLELRSRVTRDREEIESRLAQRRETLAQIDTQIARLIDEEHRRQEEERRRREAELQARLAALLGSSQGYDGPLPESDSAVVNQLIETAAAYLGIPYKWGGSRPATGFDCSGLLVYVYRQHGVDIPHYSGYQATLGAPVPFDRLEAGDLVAFGDPVHHVGLYIGDDKFIHAPQTGDVVKISPLSARSDLAAIRRFPLEPRHGPPDTS